MTRKRTPTAKQRTTAQSATRTTQPKTKRPRTPPRSRANTPSGFGGRLMAFIVSSEYRNAVRERLPSWSDEAGGMALIVVGMLTFASLLNRDGEAILSTPFADSLAQAFGYGAFLVSITVTAFGLILLLPKVGVNVRLSTMRILALELLFVASEGLFYLLSFTEEGRALARSGKGGGFIGWAIGSVVASSIGQWPAILLMSGLILVGLLLLVGVSRHEAYTGLRAVVKQLEQLADRLQAVESIPEASRPADPSVTTTDEATADKQRTESENNPATSRSEPTLNQWAGTAPAFQPGAQQPEPLPESQDSVIPATPQGPLLSPTYNPSVIHTASSMEDVLTEQSSADNADTQPQSSLPPSQSVSNSGDDDFRTLIINGEEVHIPLNGRDTETPAMGQPSIITEAQRRRIEGRRHFQVDGFHDRYKWSDERHPMLPPFELMRYADLRLPSEDEINNNARIIETTMEEFDIVADVIDVRIGPTVTQYAVSPIKEVINDDGQVEIVRTRVNKISNLASDFALALSTKRLRIQAPVPGFSYVGIEVPNREPSLVSMRSVLETETFFRKRHLPLAVPLGRDVSGDPVITDLATLPHLLIAGTTGSGKSVCLTSVITALVVNNTPDRVRMILLDPKMVELSRFNGLPHLLGPVETETERIIGVLRWAAREMDRRYKLLELENARNLEAYNAIIGEDRPDEHLPYIVIVVDEIGDLMMTRPEETEQTLTRLAQKARAAGMHLIVATQRPSVDVITGLIKANFPARGSFAVASGTDSRVILDTTGAETLIGRGDMLFLSPDAPAPVRLQGCYISDEEIYEINMYWQAWEAEMIAEGKIKQRETRVSPWAQSLTHLEQQIQLDPMLEDALQMVVAEGRASVSQIQKRMGIDYPRAAKLMDALRDLGIVGGTLAGGRNRKVLVNSVEEARRMIHNNRRQQD